MSFDKNYSDKLMSVFMHNLYSLSDSDLIILRRNFAKYQDDASLTAKVVFYKVVPREISEKKLYIWYFCACLYAYQKDKGYYKGGFSIGLAVSKISEAQNEFVYSLFDKLLREDVTEDSLILYKLGKLIKQLNNLGIFVDVLNLLNDLLLWSSTNAERIVPKRWAFDAYAKNIKNDIEGEVVNG